MKTTIRKTATNGALTALATAGLLAFAGAAQASFIVNIASQAKPTGANSASIVRTGAAFGAEADFFTRLDSRVTETFEGFTHDTPSPSTDVGNFERGLTAEDGTGTNCTKDPTCNVPRVFDQGEDVSNSGRYNVTEGSDSKMYLDSNDVTEMVWDLVPAELPSGYNALGFYLMDPADQGARFQISTNDGTQLFDISSGQNDGELFYVSAISTAGDITRASVLFDTNLNTADGFGTDDVTVGVPTPGMLAMLGSGLLALGLFGRGRKTRLTA